MSIFFLIILTSDGILFFFSNRSIVSRNWKNCSNVNYLEMQYSVSLEGALRH